MPARLVVALNQSLDGYVDHDHPSLVPDPVLFEHWTQSVREASASFYGRRMYEIMQYWEQDDPSWSAAEHAFAQAWREQPKWVASRTLETVGPNATLVSEDVEATFRALKASLEGKVDVSGTQLAASLADHDLIDEYRLYIHPVVFGGGKPFFARARPPLRLAASDRIGEAVIRLTYMPA